MEPASPKPLSLPVLIDCMPDEQPPPTGEVTWLHPNFRGRMPVRTFTRLDIDRFVGQLSRGQRARYLSLLKLLEGVAWKNPLEISRARERLNQASSIILEENKKLAADLMSIGEISVKTSPLDQAVKSDMVLQFEPRALLQMAEMLTKPDMPPMPSQAQPERVLSAEVTHLLRHARLVLWGKGAGHLGPALYCASDYLLATLAFTLIGERVGWEVCPNCGKFFRQSRPNKKWCTDACGNAYRVRKSQAKARTGSGGAGKASR